MINIFLYSFGENLLMKDGRIFKGKLVDVNKKNISLEIDDKIMIFPINLIEYLVTQVTQNSYSLLWLKRKDNTFQKAYLIKLTESALYYKTQTNNDLKIVKLSNVDKLFLYSDITTDLKYKDKITLEKDEINDVDNEINILIENIVRNRNKNKIITESEKEEIRVSTVSNPVNFEDINFYERFWARISKYLDTNNENLLWNLLEGYSEKEKSINLLYEAEEIGVKQNVKEKIIELRKDFYKRVKKIILSSGM